MIHATEAKVAAELGIDGIAHLATPEMLERYERVNAALLKDKRTVPKSCKTCYGEGWMTNGNRCAWCGGTGTVMPGRTP